MLFIQFRWRRRREEGSPVWRTKDGERKKRKNPKRVSSVICFVLKCKIAVLWVVRVNTLFVCSHSNDISILKFPFLWFAGICLTVAISCNQKQRSSSPRNHDVESVLQVQVCLDRLGRYFHGPEDDRVSHNERKYEVFLMPWFCLAFFKHNPAYLLGKWGFWLAAAFLVLVRRWLSE